MGTEVPKALVFYDNNTSNDIYSQLFVNNLFGSVRSILINNEPWFIGSDVAKCLGYARPNDAIRDHVYDEDRYFLSYGDLPWLNLDIDLGGKNNYGITIINESGLYSLILRSKLPSARQFQHWVTKEVLPTMRQIGFTNSMSILRQENERLKQEIDVYKNLHNPNKALFDLLVNTGKIQIGEKY